MIKLEKIFVLLFLLGLSVRMSAVGLDKRFQILPCLLYTSDAADD